MKRCKTHRREYLPRRIDGGFRTMTTQDLASYRAKFGRDPVPHQGPTGIKAAIDKIFQDNSFPYGQTLSPSQQQKLIDDQHILYTQDTRFSHLQLWPATRDWLRQHFSGGLLSISD
jgi:hypothetical protein